MFHMKTVKYGAWVMGLVFLAGCATTFRPWKLSEVEEGMDRAQVVDLLGEPDSAEMKNGAEILYYSYSEDYNPPLTADTRRYTDRPSQQLQDHQIRKSFQEYNYSVKLVEEKVQDYKELTD